MNVEAAGMESLTASFTEIGEKHASGLPVVVNAGPVIVVTDAFPLLVAAPLPSMLQEPDARANSYTAISCCVEVFEKTLSTTVSPPLATFAHTEVAPWLLPVDTQLVLFDVR